MAEMNEIFTRIQLKYDSYSAWTTNNPTLLPGEVAIAKLVNDVTVPVDEAKNAPVLFKVGPGAFNDLPWVSGLAADVYAWAKKPEAEFITWVNEQIEHPTLSVVDPDVATKKFITKIEVNDHQVTVTRSNVDWNDVQNKPSFEDIKVKEAVHADSADTANEAQHAKTADEATRAGHANTADTADEAQRAEQLGHSLTIKVGGEDVAFNGSVDQTADVDAAIAAAEQRAKDYADTKPNENTAHTHAVGAGFKTLTQTGGIDGEVKHELNLAFEELTVDNKLRLVDATTKTLIAEFDASEFVEDSYLQSVTYSDTDGDNVLTFVFKLNDGSETTVDVDLKHLVDVYTADETSITLVASGDGKVFKVKEAGIETKHIKDGNVTEEKLEKDVQDALALARTALQEHQSLANYKTKQGAKVYAGSTVQTVTSVRQNENGEITEVKFENIDKIATAELADVATKVQTLDDESTDSITIEHGDIIFNHGAAAEAHINAREISISTGAEPDDTAVLKVGGINEDGTNAKYSTLTKDTLTTNNVVADKVTVGGVEIKANETATGAVKYLVFNCGSSTVLVD